MELCIMRGHPGNHGEALDELQDIPSGKAAGFRRNGPPGPFTEDGARKPARA